MKADHWLTAFERGNEMGKRSAIVAVEAFGQKCDFLGITDMLPIYEEFEDGAEIIWREIWETEGGVDGIPLEVYSRSYFEKKYCT